MSNFSGWLCICATRDGGLPHPATDGRRWRTAGNRRFAYYIDVRDLDQLCAELRPKPDMLPKGDVYGPVDQELRAT